MDDTGAGRNLTSVKELVEQGIPRAVIERNIGLASSKMVFETANRKVTVDRSICMTTPGFGTREYFVLKDSPTVWAEAMVASLFVDAMRGR